MEGFTGLITAAIKAATLARTTSVTERPLPAEIRDLIRERNRAHRKWQRFRDPSDKTVMNRLALKVKRALINHRDDQWGRVLDGLDANTRSLWKMVRALNRK